VRVKKTLQPPSYMQGTAIHKRQQL